MYFLRAGLLNLDIFIIFDDGLNYDFLRLDIFKIFNNNFEFL